MEKKEVAVYLYLGVLIVASLLAVYFFNLQLTGFAVYQQNDQASFDEGVYENLEYDLNDSAVILSANQTTGAYISKVFDTGNVSTWNNLTWEGTGELDFEIRSCSDSTCSNESFASADISNINLTGQYFQYKVLFDSSASNDTLSLESVALDYSLIVEEEPQETLTITITNPSGEKASASSLPLSYSITGGENYTCWYNIRDSSDNALITAEQENIADCDNETTFSPGVGEGSYIFTLFVDSSLGLYNKTSSFSINTGPSQQTEEEEEVESTVQVPVTPTVQNLADMSLQSIATSTINPSESRNFNLVARNSGNVPLSACKLSAKGDYASWLAVSDSSQNLNVGEQKSFSFSMLVPENTEEGSYSFPLSVQCAELLRNSEFSVNVVEKRVEFNITDVERTRQDRVVVSYDLTELLDEEQTVELQFFLYDAPRAMKKRAAGLLRNRLKHQEVS